MAESVFGKPIDNDVKEIGEQISALNSKITVKKLNITATPATGVTIRNFDAYQTGDVVRVILYFDASSNINNNATIVTLSEELPSIAGPYAYADVRSISGLTGAISIEQMYRTKITTWGTLQAGTYYYAEFMYAIRP